MKKRIMSLVLCLVMVVSLLSTQVHADEGSECANCNHYHYSGYVCSGCGLCSSECSNDDCWYETHCKNCGRCFVGESKEELCEDCQRCSDCIDVCLECRKCSDCFDDYEHCQNCHKHLEGGEVCGYCDECAEAEGVHCEECGACFEGDAERCPIHEDDPHCKDCAGDYCDVCGFDQAHPLYISSQPKDLVRKVSNEDRKPFAPSHPLNNRAQFSVKAHTPADKTLSYQWYGVSTDKKTGVKSGPYALKNGVDYAKGVTTDTLDIGVPIDGCQYAYEFFCEITATAANGSSTTITSRYARLKTTHNYGPLDASDESSISEITVVLDSGNTIVYEQGSLYHNAECIGDNCGRTKRKPNTEHTYVFMEDLGGGHTTTKPGEHKYFYREACTVCGHEDLRSSDTEETIPHFITLNAPEGAYAFDVNTEETVTYAKKGAEIELFAPTLNENGHVFTGWKVIKGDVELIPNHNPGIYTFYMPAADVELEALYDSSRKPVESIKVNTIKVNEKKVPLVNRTVTVKVGDVIEATAALTPDTDIIDERVLWNVMGTVGDSHTMLHFTTSGSGILSEPTAFPVNLKALKVTGDSKLYLRATAYASKLGTDLKPVSDFIYVNIVAASEHVCEYEVTTVHPTCTLKGYTLYTCKDEECGKSYKTQFTDSLGGHKDTNDDGLCDNLNKNTGKLCGFKLSAGVSDEFVGQKKIGKTELTVIAPVTGQKPANALKAITSEEYTVANTQWVTADGTALDHNDKFAPGTVYTVKVMLEANSGYAFQLKAFSNTKSLRPAAVVKATEFQINAVAVMPGNGSSKDGVNLLYTFAVTEGIPPTEYTITVTDGKATVGAGAPVGKAAQGKTITLTADAAPAGEVFDKWVVESGSITLADASSATTTFTMPAGAVSVKATYH